MGFVFFVRVRLTGSAGRVWNHRNGVGKSLQDQQVQAWSPRAQWKGLGWILGQHEDPGMSHQFHFPVVVLIKQMRNQIFVFWFLSKAELCPFSPLSSPLLFQPKDCCDFFFLCLCRGAAHTNTAQSAGMD